MFFPNNTKHKKKNPYALVLGGGGGKGAFQIGALRALEEMRIEFEAVSGASVGALNAALVAMGDMDRAEELWRSLSIDQIVVVPEGVIKGGKLDFSLKNLLKVRNAGRKIFKDFGFDTRPLRELISRYADEHRIRQRGIDLGIVTYDLSDFTPRELFLEDIPEGKLTDYLLASASFPLFKRTEIDGKKFTDGGIYDNIPYGMIKERGYRRIIVIDVSGLGMNRRPNIIGTETIYIKNSIDLGGVLDFSKGFITDFMRLGYLDTLKVFGRLSGIRYFYEEDESLISLFAEVLRSEERAVRAILEASGKKTGGSSLEAGIRSVLPKDMIRYRQLIYCLSECAAFSLGIPQNERYTFSSFIARIEKRYRDARAADVRSHEREYTIFLRALLEKPMEKNSGFCLYEYALALETLFSGEVANITRRALEFIYSEILPARIFFHLLTTAAGRKPLKWRREE